MGGLYRGGLISGGLISGLVYKRGAYIRVGL